MKLRSAPFQSYSNFAFEAPDGAAPESPKGSVPLVKAPELPPSKYDADLPANQATFDRAYVDELRNENGTWRSKVVTERTARETAERERDEAKKAATDAKKAADKEVTEKITAAEARANERIIRAELKLAAQKAGMIDMDGLKLADVSKVTLEEDGSVKGADELMVALKEAKPYLFGTVQKGTSNQMPAPKAGDTGAPKMAKDMTADERAAFLRDHKKKFG